MYAIENTSRKILVIEDEQILGEIMLQTLTIEGYDVVLAVDGEKGLNKVREWMPDLVLLDLVMPNKTGLEVLEEMREDDKLKHIPIVIISNSGQQSELERVVEFGVKDYVIKAQFSPEDIINKVRKYLNQEDRKQQSVPKNQVGASNGIKILLAEDDQYISSIVIQQLTREGFTVLSATTGQQTLRLFEDNNPDLVMLDIIMPDMNGLEVLKAIKESATGKDVIVGMFSNNGQEHEVEEAMKSGADFFYVKVNYTLKEIVEKLRKLLVDKGKL